MTFCGEGEEVEPRAGFRCDDRSVTFVPRIDCVANISGSRPVASRVPSRQPLVTPNLTLAELLSVLSVSK
jgi:hypothetical protein